MICVHGNTSPCVECDIEPLIAENEKLREKVSALVELLDHARCNTCDGSGAIYDGYGQVEQCQWCHDRSEALTAYRKGGGV